MKDRIIANPSVVFRQEPDGWALLFDPDTDNIFTLDPVAVFIWGKLNGEHAEKDIVNKLKESCEDIPDDADKCVSDFIRGLLKKKLAGYQKFNC